MSIMDQVKKNLREWYSLAADRTGDMAKMSVRMYDKYGISREIERQLSELGSYVFHAVDEGRTDFEADSEFRALYERVKELERDLEAKVQEIDEIHQQRQQRQAAREEAAATEAAAAAEMAAAPGAEDPSAAPTPPDGESTVVEAPVITPPPAAEAAAGEIDPDRRDVEDAVVEDVPETAPEDPQRP